MADLQPHDWQKLTPRELLHFARRWSVKSWLFVGGVLVALVAASWSAGYTYRSGVLPEFVYFLEDSSNSPSVLRKNAEAASKFAEHYGELMDWRKLRSIAADIAKDHPDGLSHEFEIVASLLSQVRSTHGEAHFLSGTKAFSVKLIPSEGTINAEWNEQDSIIPRIAADAGVKLSDEELRVLNSNLNWAQFSYFDDAMEGPVVYRDLDGGLVLSIPQ